MKQGICWLGAGAATLAILTMIVGKHGGDLIAGASGGVEESGTGYSVEIRIEGTGVSEYLDLTNEAFGFSARQHKETWPEYMRDPGDRVFTYMVSFGSDRLPSFSEAGRPLSRACNFILNEFDWPKGTTLDFRGLSRLWADAGGVVTHGEVEEGVLLSGRKGALAAGGSSQVSQPSMLLRVFTNPIAGSFEEWRNLRAEAAQAWLWDSEVVEALAGRGRGVRISHLRDLLAREHPWLGRLPEVTGGPMRPEDLEVGQELCRLDLEERLESAVLWPFLRGDYLPPDPDSAEPAT